MPTMDVVGGFLGGLGKGMAAREGRKSQDETRTDLESLNQKIGRQEMGPDFVGPIRPLRSMKKGGKVRKTGLYLLHEGENVIPAGRKASRKGARKSGRSCSRR